MTTFRDLAQFYKALGDETRLQLVALLARQEPGHALCVGRLAHDLGVTPSAVSQHLRVLKDLGLVQADRQGYRIHYYLDSERLSAFQLLARDSLGIEFVLVGNDDSNDPKEDSNMCCCDEKKSCCHPEQRPAENGCAPEQIRACHGDVTEHPCERQEAEQSAE